MRHWRRWLGLIISLVAVLAAIVHVIWPGARIDGTTALLLGIALIPWLGELLESIELPGGVKVKYRDLARRQDAVEASAREASSTAQAALGAASGAKSDIEEVVGRFHELRSRHFPGRTAELDRLFGEMVNAVPPDFPVTEALVDPDDGVRLTGYAYAYGRPAAELLDPVADAMLRENLPFNQFWALNALQRILGQAGVRSLPKPLLDRLRSLAAELPDDANRQRPIKALLNMAS